MGRLKASGDAPVMNLGSVTRDVDGIYLRLTSPPAQKMYHVASAALYCSLAPAWANIPDPCKDSRQWHPYGEENTMMRRLAPSSKMLCGFLTIILLS